LALRIHCLEIDDHILEKIEVRHHISFGEVEDACLSDRRHVRKGRDGLYKLFGQTTAGRYVLVVLVNLGRGTWRVATARDMTVSERRLYARALGDG